MSKARESVFYVLGSSLFSKMISFAVSIALARILFPEDYGYILIANLFTALVQTLGNTGFETFYQQEIIKDEQHRKEILNVTTVLRFLFNFCLFLIQFMLSFLVEYLYKEPIIGTLLRIYSFNFIITGLSMTPLFILRKQIEFKPESIANMTRDISGSIVKIFCAMHGLGALSFAYGDVAGSVFRGGVLLRHGLYIPQLKRWDRNILNRIIFFGKHSFIGGLWLYVVNQIDKFLLSIAYSKEQIGFYNFGNTQSSLPYSYLVYPLSGFLTAYLAKNKNNKPSLVKLLMRNIYLLGTLFLPITVYLFVFADYLFLIVFGEKWSFSVPFFRLFVVYHYLSIFVFPVSGILNAFGYPDIWSRLLFVRLAGLATVLGICILLNVPLFVYAFAYVLTALLFAWIKAYVSVKRLDVSFISFYKSVLIHLCCGVVLYMAAAAIKGSVADLYVSLISGFAVVASLFLVVNLSLFKKAFFDALDDHLLKYPLYKRIKSYFID
ncbi:oligosaccharide flippase family protein [Marinilabiliaceae bacterium ANBcel2]|nr:oligosaccharide flippase family protein [Marinilabiliaceae bacterium ANBcel2]